jgi:hypothetical protein
MTTITPVKSFIVQAPGRTGQENTKNQSCSPLQYANLKALLFLSLTSVLLKRFWLQ